MEIFTIQSLLNDFLAYNPSSLSWDETWDWFRSKSPASLSPESLKRSILRHNCFLADPDSWEIYNKAAYFLGREFQVFPSPYECEHAVFMPGSNLIPYEPFNCPPTGASFIFKGSALRNRVRELPVELLKERYEFFGAEEAGILINIDHVGTKRRGGVRGAREDANEDNLLRSTVFDAADIFADPDFDPRRGLVFTFASSTVFVIRAVAPGKEISPELRERARQALTRGFRIVLTAFPADIGMSAQIAQAYWLAFRDLPTQTFPSLVEYMRGPDAPQIAEYGLDTILRAGGGKGYSKTHKPLAESPSHPSQAGRDLDLLLSKYPLPLRSPDIEAMLRASPDSGVDEIQMALSSLFSARLGSSEADRIRLCLEGIRAYIKETTDYFLEGRISAIRSQALSLYLGFLSRGMKANTDTVFDTHERSDRLAIEQLIAELRAIVIGLNSPQPMSDEQLASLGDSIDDLGAALDILLADTTKPGRRSAKRPASRKKRNMESVYTLSFSIAGLKPPVSRRLSLPGSCSLGQLSDCILSCLGWSGSHLHCFRVGEKIYGRLDSSSLPLELDEEDTILDDLALLTESQFEYEYDFDSSWILKIRVDEIGPPQGASSPLCLDGRGASPPEESGGPLKYMRFLKDWNGKASPEYVRKQAYFNENWNPESFDLAEVQRRFSAIWPEGKI